MIQVRAFVIAASLLAAVALPTSLFGQTGEWRYFLVERPLVSEIGAYTDASLSAATALSLTNPSNTYYKKAAAHAKTADEMQNAIEGLYYWVGDYPYPYKKNKQTLAKWEEERDAWLATYTYDPIFYTYYIPLRAMQAEKSLFAANDIVNGKGKNWTASALTAYNHCMKAQALGQYDLGQE